MKKKYWLFLFMVIIILMPGIIVFLIFQKKIKVTPLIAEKYELQGIDVSHYQGDIDWKTIEGQNINFAYIKATEGSSYIDECFEKNWKAAQKTGIWIGAYHFFSFDSPGRSQAASYIDTVGKLSGKLAPVIDVEYYGNKAEKPLEKEAVIRELKEMLVALEEHYHIKPIIYTTYKAYYDFIKDEFKEYPLWIRNVYFTPFINLGNSWTFWQYTDTAVLEGYKGEEKYIDRNVFNGTWEELRDLIVVGDTAENDESMQESTEEKKEEENGEEKDLDEEESDKDSLPLLEQLFDYEQVRNFDEKENYLIITGINERYEEQFEDYMREIADKTWNYYSVILPADANGIPVKEIGEEAFCNVHISSIVLADSIEKIGSGAFKNSGLSKVQLSENLLKIEEEAFAGCNLENVEFPNQPVTVENRAFADNKELWKVLFPNVQSVISENAFEGCDSDFLICYGKTPEGKENLVIQFADRQGMEAMELIIPDEPVVNYHDEPLILKPEVKGFFYGQDGDYDSEEYWNFDMSADAPNFGFVDWHLPGCSTWCGCIRFHQEAEASSELASANGRYEAENVLKQNRNFAWAEGTEGVGIGESISYRQSCEYGIDNKFQAIRKENREPELDGFMRYSEICIVNGYARNEKTWEENGRVKKLLMKVEGKPYAYLELEDTILPQYYTLPEDDIKVLNGEMIEFEFVIEEVYPGSVYEDTCLTGIVMEFTGRFAH